MGHLNAVRQQRHLRSAVIVIIVEANLCWVRARSVSQALQRAIEENEHIAAGHGIPQRRSYVYSHDTTQNDRPGVWLTNDSTWCNPFRLALLTVFQKGYTMCA